MKYSHTYFIIGYTDWILPPPPSRIIFRMVLISGGVFANQWFVRVLIFSITTIFKKTFSCSTTKCFQINILTTVLSNFLICIIVVRFDAQSKIDFIHVVNWWFNCKFFNLKLKTKGTFRHTYLFNTMVWMLSLINRSFVGNTKGISYPLRQVNIFNLLVQ